MTECRDQLGARSAGAEIAVRLVAGVVDATLHLEALGERVEVAGRRARRTRGRDVEKAVEVDPERGVDAAAAQRRCRVALQRVVERVRRGERVMDGVPVGVVVLDVEASESQRGGVRDRSTELLVVDPGAHRCEEGIDDRVRIVLQKAPRERGHGFVVELAARRHPRRALPEVPRSWASAEHDEVMWMAPLRDLFRTLRLPRSARRASGAPAAPRRRRGSRVLRRLVREVDRVALVDEHVVRYGGEHHGFGVRSRSGSTSVVSSTRSAASDALVSMKREYQPASRSTGTPSLVSGPTGNRAHARAVSPATNTRPCTSASARSSRGGGGGGSPSRSRVVSPVPQPDLAVANAELHAGAHDRTRIDARVEEPEHRLRHDERDVLLETFAEATLQVADRIRFGTRPHEDVAVGDLDVEAPRVVRPQVERAARNEIEACVVPVAGDEPRLDGSLVEREPEVRAAVLDRVPAAVVPEHDDRERADLRPELAGRPCRSAWVPARVLSLRSSSRGPSPLFTRTNTCDNLLRDGSRQVRPPRTPELGDSKRKIVERLKRADATPGELATALGLTEAGAPPAPRRARIQRVRGPHDPSARGTGPPRERVGAHRPRATSCSRITTTTSPSTSSTRSGARSATTG